MPVHHPQIRGLKDLFHDFGATQPQRHRRYVRRRRFFRSRIAVARTGLCRVRTVHEELG